MKKFSLVLLLVAALVALVGCKGNSSKDVSGEDLKENDPYYESLNIVNYSVFGEPELIAGTGRRFQIIDSVTVEAQLGYIQFIAWCDGVTYISKDSKFEGKGFIIKSIVPIYVITSPAYYAGSYLPPKNGYRIGDTTTPTEGVMAAGKIDPATYGDWAAYCNGESKTYDSVAIWSKTNGTLISRDNYSDKGSHPESYSGLYRGQVNKLVINLDERYDIASWGADVTWSNTTSEIRYYGFQIDPETRTLVRPYNFKTVNRKFHEDVLNEAQSTPARTPRAIRSVAELRRPLMVKK